MIDAAPLILSSRNEVRRYASAPPRYVSTVQDMVAEYERIHPSESFRDCCQVVSKTRRTKNCLPYATLDVKHMVVPGPADITELEKFVGSPLPKCLTDFYSQITECLLPLQFPVRIYSPKTVVHAEKEIRETERSVGFPVPEDITLLRLIEIDSDSSCFALRKFVCDGHWRMVVCTTELTSELQSNDGLWLLDDCEEFDVWFKRVLEKDAFPLVESFPELFGDNPLAIRQR